MKRIKYPVIAAKLLKLARVDQNMRLRDLRNTGSWDKRVDRFNTAELRKIVAEIGWPTHSLVGKRAAHAAWLIAQHADHAPRFQWKCMRLMEDVGVEEIQLSDLAHLSDRVTVRKHGWQQFGTQFREVAGLYEPVTIIEPTEVNRRRKDMGLPTLRQGIIAHRRKYVEFDRLTH